MGCVPSRGAGERHNLGSLGYPDAGGVSGMHTVQGDGERTWGDREAYMGQLKIYRYWARIVPESGCWGENFEVLRDIFGGAWYLGCV